MKSAFAFASRHFWCFDCQSRILHFAIWLLFLLVSLISTGVFVKMPREWIRIALWLHGLWLTSVCTFFILTEKKIHKKVVEYSTDRPSTHLRRKFNWFQLSALNFNFLHIQKKLNSLLLSANERAESFATCRHFDLKSIIWSQSTASHLFAQKRFFHRPTLSSLLARWHLSITITSYLHTL